MGRQIIKMPGDYEEDLYCEWSSIVDNFIFTHVTKEELIKERVKEAKKEIISKVEEIIKKLDNGEKPYYQFTQTFKEALLSIKTHHGMKEYKHILKHFGMKSIKELKEENKITREEAQEKLIRETGLCLDDLPDGIPLEEFIDEDGEFNYGAISTW